MTLVLLIGAATGLYVLLALGAAAVLRRARAVPPLPDDALPIVSVLVAARDEEEALPGCLDALRRQHYPAGRFECIVADDGSTDGTAEVVARYARADARFRYVAVPRDGGPLRGKAHALHTAIGAARGTLLLVTDADCRPPPGWAHHLASQFQDPETGVVCGLTVVRHRSLLDRVQALDWTLLLGVAAGAAGAGLPITAMGNNMAIRRAAYDDVGGYPALPFSVTEDYALFRAVHATRRWRVQLLPDRQLGNVTLPVATLRVAFRQRLRWARGGLSAAPWVYLFYAVVFGCHAGLLAGLFAAPGVALTLLAAKLAADLVVIVTAMEQTGQRGLLRSFLPFEGFLFGYVVLLPVALVLAPRTHWKGRRL